MSSGKPVVPFCLPEDFDHLDDGHVLCRGVLKWACEGLLMEREVDVIDTGSSNVWDPNRFTPRTGIVYGNHVKVVKRGSEVVMLLDNQSG